jgi:hypothetical protein
MRTPKPDLPERAIKDEERRKLQDDLFSKVDYYLENEPPPASGDIFNAVNACLPSLYLDYGDDDDGGLDVTALLINLTGDVAKLLISHAEWIRRRQKQERA